MAENREEILANFQGITAIEDVAEAIFHLDECNWDLLAAINRVMPQDGTTHRINDNDTHQVEMIDEDISVITTKARPTDPFHSNEASTSSSCSSSNSNGNLVELQVNYNNKMHDVKMSASATVTDLKKRLESVCGVPICRQQISGLGGSKATSSASLGSLNLPRNAVLRLKAADELMADDEVAERLTTTYTLKVKHAEKEYTLSYPGTKTVLDVKNDIYSFTDIPPRHQVWTGWPSVGGLDETVLAMVGLHLPEHTLTVTAAPSHRTPRTQYKRRKLLAVYLHHEQSVLSNVFCAQLLGCETVLQTLSANFLIFGWDMTHSNNANMLLTSIANALGPMASMTIRSIPVERLPALVIIMRIRSNTEIYSVINGNVGVSELVGQLMEALERWGGARGEEVRAEEEREDRQRVKREQDEAYQRSLDADRAKEEVRKQQEQIRLGELEKAESERAMFEERQRVMRETALARVPAPPPASHSHTATLRVRLPDTHLTPLQRTFFATDTLQALFDFLASQGYPEENYKVISSWPRRDLTTLPRESTFESLKLYPQETVILEER